MPSHTKARLQHLVQHLEFGPEVGVEQQGGVTKARVLSGVGGDGWGEDEVGVRAVVNVSELAYVYFMDSGS